MYVDFSESFVRVINKPNTLQRISKFVLLPLLRSGQELPTPRLEIRNATLGFWATIYLVKTLSWTIWWMFSMAIDSRLESSGLDADFRRYAHIFILHVA